MVASQAIQACAQPRAPCPPILRAPRRSFILRGDQLRPRGGRLGVRQHRLSDRSSHVQCALCHHRAGRRKPPRRPAPGARAASGIPLRGWAHGHRGPYGRCLRRAGAHGSLRSKSLKSIAPPLARRVPQNVAFCSRAQGRQDLRSAPAKAQWRDEYCDSG